MNIPQEGRARVVIEDISPSVDGGRFAIKRTAGESVVVEANAFADGHDEMVLVLLHARDESRCWERAPMQPLGNDRWRGEFRVTELGRYRYTLQGWVDHFATWRRDLGKRLQAGQDVTVELEVGARLVDAAARRAESSEDMTALRDWAKRLRAAVPAEERARLALGDELPRLMARWPDLCFATTAKPELGVIVDRERARFSAWYELFPRSCSGDTRRHGTFRDVEARLPYIAGMGFDVLYLPPIHPIGHNFRKGKNNAPTGQPGDVGSPWAIGSAEGGHTAIHPALGTLGDFRRLVARAREFHMEVALDLAIQCSPDHPWVKDHPEWFKHRPDGSIRYAENPPKKYQDIYPIDFETDDWQSLWEELKRVLLFWIDQGVLIFRVDNPHTKAFAFWEWVIADVKRQHPGVIFLAEAFTRPKVMYRLARLGFTQSYTYFAWRNSKWELTEYLTELTRTSVKEFFRPNVWPNTPDILTAYLVHGGRPAFAARFVLAATLCASYGIYGPAFELGVNVPREPGSEEYLNSEKYEIKAWDLDAVHSLKGLITKVNQARRDNPALQSNDGLRFHGTDNDQLLCYSKQAGDNLVLAVVNLNPQWKQWGFVQLALEGLPLDQAKPFEVHDLLTGTAYTWQGARNYVELDPQRQPAHVFRVRQH